MPTPPLWKPSARSGTSPVWWSRATCTARPADGAWEWRRPAACCGTNFSTGRRNSWGAAASPPPTTPTTIWRPCCSIWLGEPGSTVWRASRPGGGSWFGPLLTTPRADIEAYLEEHHLNHVEDCTNADDSYARNKLRHQVIPVLRELNPRLTERSVETMGYLRSDNDYLNAQAALACSHARWAEDDLVIEARYIAELPAAIAPRAARRLLEMTGDGNTDCSAAHLKAVVDLAVGDDPSAVAFLPNGRLAQRVYRELLFTTQAERPAPLVPCPLNTDGETAPEGSPWRCACRAAICPPAGTGKPGAWYLSREAQGPLMLRPRQTGDETGPAGPGRDQDREKMDDRRENAPPGPGADPGAGG